MKDRKKPLYRKVNTRARGVHHNSGSHYRYERNSKGERRGPMKQGVQRGLDYSPLFRYLLSKVGEDWDIVHSEAVSRLDRPDPIFWMVAIREQDRRPFVRVGESSYFSGLFVDDDNRLQIVAPEIGPEDMEPYCGCCTHTLNGVPFQQPYRGRRLTGRYAFLYGFYSALSPPLDEGLAIKSMLNDPTAVWRNVFGRELSRKSLANVSESELERLRDECVKYFDVSGITTDQIRRGIAATIALLEN